MSSFAINQMNLLQWWQTLASVLTVPWQGGHKVIPTPGVGLKNREQ